MIPSVLSLLSCGALGVFLGAQLTEAVLFVPFWKRLPPDDFFALHKTYGKAIYQFFAPLTIVATVLPIVTVLYLMMTQSEHHLVLACMGTSTLLFFSTYSLYFKSANKSFADRTILNDELPRELDRWGTWHWARVCLECIALVSSLLLIHLL